MVRKLIVVDLWWINNRKGKKQKVASSMLYANILLNINFNFFYRHGVRT